MGTNAVSGKQATTSVSPDLIEIASPGDIPEFASDEEAAEYWDTHAPGPHFFDGMPIERDPLLPPPRGRSTPLSVRFDADTIARLKAVAARKHKGYQTLLKEFVFERLYEEEKREGIIGGDPAATGKPSTGS